MKKRILLVIISIILFSCVVGFINWNENRIKGNIEFVFYPTSLEETYKFVLNPYGELSVEKGIRDSNEVTKSPFIAKTEQYKKIKLSHEDTAVIFDMADKVYNCNHPKKYTHIHDWWSVGMIYRGKVVTQGYDEYLASEEVMNLAKAFIDISPIKVNLLSSRAGAA